MLKTLQDGKVWLVSQPDHSEIAGYFARWGDVVHVHVVP